MQTNTQLTGTEPSKKTNWSQVFWFLGLTFGLTWIIDLVLYLNGGLTNPAGSLILQLQMLLPAFSAMFLGVFFFKDSPIYYQTNKKKSRWFIYYYFLLTFLYFIGSILGLIRSDQAAILSSVLLIPNLIGLILLVVLRFTGGKDAYANAGMAGGKVRIWLLYGLGLIIFYGLQTFLNFIFNLGQVVDLQTAFPQMADANLPCGSIDAHHGAQYRDHWSVPWAADRLWRGIRMAWLPAEPVDPPWPHPGCLPAGDYLGCMALASDLDGLQLPRLPGSWIAGDGGFLYHLRLFLGLQCFQIAGCLDSRLPPRTQ